MVGGQEKDSRRQVCLTHLCLLTVSKLELCSQMEFLRLGRHKQRPVSPVASWGLLTCSYTCPAHQPLHQPPPPTQGNFGWVTDKTKVIR